MNKRKRKLDRTTIVGLILQLLVATYLHWDARFERHRLALLDSHHVHSANEFGG